MNGRLHKGAQGERGGDAVAPTHGAGVVVLPGLGHEGGVSSDFFDADVFGIFSDGVANGGEFAERVGEDAAVGGAGKLVDRQMEPTRQRFWWLFVADEGAVEAVDFQHTDTAAALGAGDAPADAEKVFRQGVVGNLQGLAVTGVVLRRKPDAEGRAVVVVGGDGVVKAEAFRALADEADRRPWHKLRKPGFEHGFAVSVVVTFGEFQSFDHGCASFRGFNVGMGWVMGGRSLRFSVA